MQFPQPFTLTLQRVGCPQGTQEYSIGAFLHAMHDSGGGPEDSKDDLQDCWAAAGLSSMLFGGVRALVSRQLHDWQPGLSKREGGGDLDLLETFCVLLLRWSHRTAEDVETKQNDGDSIVCCLPHSV